MPAKLISAAQRGFALMETMIGVLLIAIGILAVLALQGTSIAQSRDAKYRSEASFAAMELLATISANADRSTAVATSTTVCLFRLNSANANSPGCAVPGARPPQLASWLTRMTNMLPNAPAAAQTIDVDAAAGNRVTITMSWQSPQDTSRRNFVLVGVVN